LIHVRYEKPENRTNFEKPKVVAGKERVVIANGSFAGAVE
jgi:hypothetical protein